MNGNDRIVNIEYSHFWEVGEFLMIIKLNKNNINIPEEIIKELKLQHGQNLNLELKNNSIVITPLTESQSHAFEVKAEYEYYKQNPDQYKVYSDIDQLIKDLDE